MKRVTKVLLVAALAAALCLSQGCTGNSRGADGFPSDYEVAVIRTSDYAASTYIEFYDRDLNLISTLRYPYTCVENMGDSLSVSGDAVYVAHRGSIYGRNGGQVLGITPRTGEIREYSVTQPVVAEVTATEKSIFVTGGMGDVSYITQVDKATGDSVEVKFEGCFLHSLATDGDRVIVVQDFLDGNDNTLLIFSDPAHVEKRIKVTGLGSAGPIANAIDGKFYFKGSLFVEERDANDYTLNYYSLPDDSIKTIFASDYPVRFVVANTEHLFLMQQDVNATEQSKIVIIDKDTEEVVDAFPVTFVPDNMEEHDGFLYLLGYDRYTGSPCFAQYRIDGSQLTKVNENNLSDVVTNKGRFFASGMFFNT